MALFTSKLAIENKALKAYAQGGVVVLDEDRLRDAARVGERELEELGLPHRRVDGVLCGDGGRQQVQDAVVFHMRPVQRHVL